MISERIGLDLPADDLWPRHELASLTSTPPRPTPLDFPILFETHKPGSIGRSIDTDAVYEHFAALSRLHDHLINNC